MSQQQHYDPAAYEQAKILSRLVLDEKQCDEIIKSLDNNLNFIAQGEFRAVLARDISMTDVPYLKDTILSANDSYFRFLLDHNHADFFFAKYEPGMHYQEFHMDCIAGTTQRKLTFSLMLNDEFEGGEFEILGGSAIKKERGKLLVFPSYLAHRITPVSNGVRYAIFGWFYGPSYT